MTTCSSLGAGDGVVGVEIAAACRRVLALDMSCYRSPGEFAVACSFSVDEIRLFGGFRVLTSEVKGFWYSAREKGGK
jgi:hypothetical protein